MKVRYEKENNRIYPADYLIGKRVVLTQDGFEMQGEVVIISSSGIKVNLNSIDSKLRMSVPESTFIKAQIVTIDSFPELYL